MDLNKEHDTDHTENVHLTHCVMEKLQKNRTDAEMHLGYELKKTPGREVTKIPPPPPPANDRKEKTVSQGSVFHASKLRNV